MASKLPAAPLVEVIFEYRWALSGDPNLPTQLHSDPGYAVMADKFSAALAPMGFPIKRVKQVGPSGPLGHAVHLQFAPNETAGFPLAQIGPGLLASNDSADYEWGKFKARTLDFVKALYDTYPAMSSFSVNPVHVELRYVDSFNLKLLGHSDVVRFINESSTMKFAYAQGSYSKPLGAVGSAHVMLSFPMKEDSDTNFAFEITTGKYQDVPTVVLVSKVVTQAASIPIDGRRGPIKFVDAWLEKAHAVTSPFFREFVSDKLMAEFGARPRREAKRTLKRK